MIENSNNKHELFDLIVIGTGTATSVSALQCSSAGWNVAIIDSLPFGGTCALRGCVKPVESVSQERLRLWIRT